MTMVNEFYCQRPDQAATSSSFCCMLSPFAPHMVEEMWELTGYAAKTGKMAMQMPWPKYDEAKTT